MTAVTWVFLKPLGTEVFAMGVIRPNRLTWFRKPSASWFGVKQFFGPLPSLRDYAATLQQLASGPTVIHLAFYRCLLPRDFAAPPLLKGYSIFSFLWLWAWPWGGNTLQYSCPENPTDRGAWLSMGSQELDTTERLSHHQRHHETCFGEQNMAEMIVHPPWVCGAQDALQLSSLLLSVTRRKTRL